MVFVRQERALSAPEFPLRLRLVCYIWLWAKAGCVLLHIQCFATLLYVNVRLTTIETALSSS